RGNIRTPGQPGYVSFRVSPVGTAGWPGAPSILVPSELSFFLSQLISEDARRQPNNNESEPIPIFVAELSAHDEIAARAYASWQKRGCPWGSPEVDWSLAEAQLGVSEANLSALSLESLVERLPPVAMEWPRIEVIRLARENWERRSPFQLPLDV